MVDGLGSFVADSLDNSVAGGLDNSLTDGLDNSKVSDLYSSSAAGSVNATMTIHLNQLGQLLIQPGKLGQHLVKLGQDTRRIQILIHVYGDMLISRCWDHTSRGRRTHLETLESHQHVRRHHLQIRSHAHHRSPPRDAGVTPADVETSSPDTESLTSSCPNTESLTSSCPVLLVIILL